MTWGLRGTIFLTNSAVLIGYACLFNWLQTAKFTQARDQRLRMGYLIAITVAFLLLFHYASIFQMAALGNRPGFGWNYINFQVATVLYALLLARERPVLLSLAAVLFVWYWWLPNAPQWTLYWTLTLLMMICTQECGAAIGRRWWCYYPYCLGFAAPLLALNFVSVHGIVVGWPWQVATYLVICWMLRTVQDTFKRQRERQAGLLAAAQHDDLTHLWNFRVFSAALQTAYDRARRTGTPYALFTFDIDDFKRVNDRYGHLVGNQVLQGVATRLVELTAALGPGVQSYRTGGEEFSFILPGAAPEPTLARQIAWQIHDELGRLSFTAPDGRQFGVTVSLGADHSDARDQNYLDVYKRADHALYQAKRSGRDRVTVAGETLWR
ncbi:GGDEF domain-containing protein [Lacticaseibacillus absianus]|uniref:GGDEF domain-containing protein n=1 Tax=Lacticaseibacillus absianus TaxID=2729623 RepID=UPI0015CEBD2D|nr:GGDEF domain-containing protein [Lacticaseibacillus absianus]